MYMYVCMRSRSKPVTCMREAEAGNLVSYPARISYLYARGRYGLGTRLGKTVKVEKRDRCCYCVYHHIIVCWVKLLPSLQWTLSQLATLVESTVNKDHRRILKWWQRCVSQWLRNGRGHAGTNVTTTWQWILQSLVSQVVVLRTIRCRQSKRAKAANPNYLLSSIWIPLHDFPFLELHKRSWRLMPVLPKTRILS